METLPIIRVAMFGTRSTGKTNFLACLPALTESISSLKGCTLSIPDPETKALLAPLNDTLKNGDIPDATKAQFPQSMRFILQRQLSDNADKDFMRWYVDFFDYAGELLESIGSDDYNVLSTTDENGEQAVVPTVDPKYEKFKERVKGLILEADAVLFFIPVDYDERPLEDQKKLRRIITDIIQPALSDTAKPLVYSLTKWDKTDIEIEESQITDDLQCINSPSVEQYINSNEFFSLTYENAVKNLGKNVAVMPISSRLCSSSLPVRPNLRRSTSIRWLSVPPETRLKPQALRASARALAFATTLC